MQRIAMQFTFQPNESTIPSTNALQLEIYFEKATGNTAKKIRKRSTIPTASADIFPSVFSPKAK